ncbi:hypothetical protein JMG10_03515 [Nostoc ellipsosporum NOK]|nr:hypothetical protein [Nostoc ellipsosporum NOK]
MICVFCRNLSKSSKSIEHIIPESLGNIEHILPPGIVCDNCNAYFGTKVEKELLEQPFFKHVRHRQHIKTKRGKAVPWIAYSLFPVSDADRYNYKKNNKEHFIREFLTPSKLYYIPHIHFPRYNILVARFLAKVGIEALAKICLENQLNLNEIVDNEALQPLREFARYGHGSFWPYHQRIIYDENRMWQESNSTPYQLLHEYNIVSFKRNEYYLVLAIFGIEFIINLGARNIKSFFQWKILNPGKSPLDYDHFPVTFK